MPSIIIGRKGYLVVQFYHRKQRCREYLKLQDTRDNRRDAQRFAKELGKALGRADFNYLQWFPNSRHVERPEAPKAEPTVSEYYKRGTLELTQATRYDYEALGRAFLDRTELGPKKVAEVTVTDIRGMVRDTASRTRRCTMILQRLRTMFEAAIDDGLISSNPAQRVKNPRVRGRREVVDPFTPAEQQALLNVVTGQDRNLIAVLLGLGLRPGEALALRRNDIDFKLRKVAVTGSLSRFGEGPTKTTETRIVDLLDAVAPVVTALRDQMSTLRVGPLFANESHRFLNFTNWRERNWKRALEEAGIKYRSPYVCRHTYAVRMLQAGYDPVYVARQMGHSSTEMIHRHYAKWTLDVRAQVTTPSV